MGPLEFNYPRAIALAPNGLLYVVDKAARVQALTADGEYRLGWRMPDFTAGKPTGLTIAGDGAVYFADTHYSRILTFDAQGRPLAEFGTFGDGPGQFRLPTDVAIDPRGFIYVSEYGGNDRISKFDTTWKFLLAFDGSENGGLRIVRPQSLLVAPDATLWVADACNHRICQFDADGKLLRSFGSLGDGRGELRFPYGVERLSDGTLVVCEYGNNRLQRFSADGASLGVWGETGRELGQLAYPWALAVDADDRVYVMDSGNNRVQVIDGRAIAGEQTAQ